MKEIRLVDPFRCRMWPLHDRFQGLITADSCRAEIESFREHGQLVPAVGRPLLNDPQYEIELIAGARRLFVARHINKPLAVDVRELSDREAIVVMDVENRHRLDISPYERGMSYARWLRGGYFDSQEAIARALNVSGAHVSRLLKLARLPSVVVSAFESAVDIAESWGVELAEIWEDPQRRPAMAQSARALALQRPRPAAREVYQQLLVSSVRGRKPPRKGRSEVVLDPAGTPLFRILHQTRSIVLLLPADRISTSHLLRLRQALVAVLHDETAQCIDTREE